MRASRREVLAAGACTLLLPIPAFAQTTRFAIDWQGGPENPDIAAALAAQIALIEALPIDPAIIAFFAGQRIAVDVLPGSMSRIAPDGVHFERRAVPPDNPVLLHELLHRYHLLRLASGYANETVRTFYREARASGLYPPAAYMLVNPIEFFAMTASVVLYGRLARPPFLRATVAEKSPELYRWIVGEFGLRL
ncbi:MAG: hypothetical protein JWN66_1388 [Sphingomonas bacterium]|uniref:hypothetical protein n=1 Tax=Sphingomonas bacterium TaxID=1895847 RepID=UPI00261A59E6|nr:hypothetical protein [Sphingomonas bacterium]MDB5704272.1 hypothetical protein [Sphingomonas bacterium]